MHAVECWYFSRLNKINFYGVNTENNTKKFDGK